MSKQNKLILSFIFILLVFSLVYKAKKYIVEKDYFVYVHIPCSDVGICFENEEMSSYLKMYRKAYRVEYCYRTGECDPLICGPNEGDCTIISCSEESVEDGENCLPGKDIQ